MESNFLSLSPKKNHFVTRKLSWRVRARATNDRVYFFAHVHINVARYARDVYEYNFGQQRFSFAFEKEPHTATTRTTTNKKLHL